MMRQIGATGKEKAKEAILADKEAGQFAERHELPGQMAQLARAVDCERTDTGGTGQTCRLDSESASPKDWRDKNGRRRRRGRRLRTDS